MLLPAELDGVVLGALVPRSRLSPERGASQLVSRRWCAALARSDFWAHLTLPAEKVRAGGARLSHDASFCV